MHSDHRTVNKSYFEPGNGKKPHGQWQVELRAAMNGYPRVWRRSIATHHRVFRAREFDRWQELTCARREPQVRMQLPFVSGGRQLNSSLLVVASVGSLARINYYEERTRASEKDDMQAVGVTMALAIIFVGLSQNAASDEQTSVTKRRFETCRAQIEEYVDSRFHQTVTQIKFDFVFDYRSAGGGDGTKSIAVVYTKECPGYHIFELFATDFVCNARAHVGTAPNYIYYRTSEDGC